MKLEHLLSLNSFRIKKINLIQPILKSVYEKQLVKLTFIECFDSFLEHEILTKDKFQNISDKLSLLARGINNTIALPRTTQICGYKN